MITTLHVRVSWDPDKRVPDPYGLGRPMKITDARVLLAVHQGLLGTPGVAGADLLSTEPVIFVVAVDDKPLDDPVMEALRLAPAALDDGSITFRVAWGQDGGIKVALASVRLEIA